MNGKTVAWEKRADAAIAKLERVAKALERVGPLATEQALLEAAGAHAKATTITWDEYLRRVREQPGYAYQNTNWYAAGRNLEATKHLEPAPQPPKPPSDAYLAAARARIFLAHDPENCLQAPASMTPVCTADRAYRHYYSPSLIARLRGRFRRIEVWCDAVNTTYSEAERMVAELGLDGPPWGQCETGYEFDTSYAAGARRMVGKIDADVMDDARLAKVASGEVLVSVELYRNCQPGLQPDWRNANAGIGGNCIACYQDADCAYTSVADYLRSGLYVAGRDSVYGVGLTEADWRNLAAPAA